MNIDNVYSYVCVTIDDTKYYTGFINAKQTGNEASVNSISWTTKTTQ